MTDAMEIPSFLCRTPQKENTMTAPAPAPEPTARKRRTDAYVARITAKIPLDMTNGQSLVDAMDAVKGLSAHLPAGTVLDVSAGMGKL